MAQATQFENILALAHTDTISGAKAFKLMLTAGSAAATLTLTVGSNTVTLAAVTGDTSCSPCIRLGAGVEATVALTGTGAKAYAILE